MEDLAVAIIEGLINLFLSVLGLIWMVVEGCYDLGKTLYNWIKSRRNNNDETGEG